MHFTVGIKGKFETLIIFAKFTQVSARRFPLTTCTYTPSIHYHKPFLMVIVACLNIGKWLLDEY